MFRMNDLADRDLRVRVTESDGQIVISFNGVSDAREPGRFLEPILTAATATAERGSKELVLDFRSLERMNSSTVPPIIHTLHQAKVGPLRLTVLYARFSRWQAMSFTALKIFESGDGRVAILPS